MDRRRRILGLALIVVLVALTGDVAGACATMATESCCCDMMDAAPCREVSDKTEASRSARGEALPTREQGPVAILDWTAPAAGAGASAAPVPLPVRIAVPAESSPLYLRNCSLLN